MPSVQQVGSPRRPDAYVSYAYASSSATHPDSSVLERARPGVFGATGDQVRGFGFLHDGSIDSVFRFLSSGVFSINDDEQRDLLAFVMAFDSDLPPMVGQQITRTSTNGAAVDARITAMVAAASTAYPSEILGPGAQQFEG